MINLLIVFFLFTSIPFYGQSKYDKNDLNDMINNSMIKVIDIHKGFVKDGIMKQEIFDKHYLLKDNLPLNFSISDSIKQLNLRIAYLGEISSKELKKGISCFSFSFLNLDSDTIKIHIITKNMKVKGKTLENSLGDGFTFSYKYFCNEKKWKLVDSKPKL